MLKIYLFEAIKNFQKNKMLTLTAIFFIVSMLVFAGVISSGLRIQDAFAELGEKQEAFIEYSQYYFSITEFMNFVGADYNKAATNYINWNLTGDPIIDEKDIKHAYMLDEFYESLLSTPGFYLEFCMGVGMISRGQDELVEIDISFEGYSYFVTENFFKYESLIFLEGDVPKERDFGEFDEDGYPILPVIVGYQFADYVKIGDILTRESIFEYRKHSTDFDDNAYKYSTRFKVVGILDKGHSVLMPSGFLFINLSDKIIAPYNLPLLSYTGFVSNEELLKNASELAFGLPNVKIYVNKTVEDTALLKLQEIIDKAELTKFMTPYKAEHYAKMAVEITDKRTEGYLVVAICVAALTFVGSVVLFLMRYRSIRRDMAVHRLVGATIWDIVACNMLEMSIFLIISDILVHFPYIYKNIEYLNRNFGMTFIFAEKTRVYSYILFINIFMLLLSFVLSLICFGGKKDIAAEIKGKE